MRTVLIPGRRVNQIVKGYCVVTSYDDDDDDDSGGGGGES
jgi:hypothetical protein